MTARDRLALLRDKVLSGNYTHNDVLELIDGAVEGLPAEEVTAPTPEPTPTPAETAPPTEAFPVADAPAAL